MAEILYKDESYRIVGACFEVYNQKGFGFTEPVYQECLEIEFALQNVPFRSQPEIRLGYKGHTLGQYFRPDFVVFDKIIVEIKAVERIVNSHRAQALNYLNATYFELALLVNFGQHPRLEYERIVKSRSSSAGGSLLDEIGDLVDAG